MNIPGFTADASLYENRNSYRMHWASSPPNVALPAVISQDPEPFDREQCYRECVQECVAIYPNHPKYCRYTCYGGCILADN
jgi:hypothetical protein